jgi:hypothetical protein
MPKDENKMTKEGRNRPCGLRHSAFDICHSFVILFSSFVISSSPFGQSWKRIR